MGQKLLHYEVLESLGQGARSTIYKVLDPTTKQTFALKHVRRSDAKDIRFIEQMEAEFEISRTFNHKNLRRSFDLKIVKTLLLKVSEAFLVMEYFDGMPLEEGLPTDLVDVLDTFIQASEGIRAMNQMGFVHCDLKPNNILRSRHGVVKVIDFGQSCRVGTIKERIQGTPDFIAPEQVNRKPVTIQTDVYNLGATLYWAVTGRHIPTLYTVNKKGENSFLLDATIPSPVELNPICPMPVSNMILECVSTSTSKRPPDMDSIIRRLELGKHVLLKSRDPNWKPDPSIADSLTESKF
ncbi:MAG: serine/threonine protein kinase [Burkholderiales bacterium]|nr:serine/threonine protein kinase [Phycisphaerae bacterium]